MLLLLKAPQDSEDFSPSCDEEGFSPDFEKIFNRFLRSLLRNKTKSSLYLWTGF